MVKCSSSPAAAETCASAAGEKQAECSSAINVANFVSTKLHRDENCSNYKSRKAQMLCLIKCQGLDEFIDEDRKCKAECKAWRQTDWLVKGWILGALSDQLLDDVADLDSAADVWLELEYKFAEPLEPPQWANQGKDWNEYLELYKAAISGDWDKANQFHDQEPGAFEATVDASTEQTALHVAVAAGTGSKSHISFVRNMVDLMTNEQLAITDKIGYTPLHVAAMTGNLDAADILVKKHAGLLYVPSNSDRFSVHVAADFGHRETLEFLISKTIDRHATKPFDHGLRGLVLLNFMIDADFFDMAFDLVDKHPDLATENHNSDRTALESIALKDKAFSVEAKLKFWEHLLYSCIKVEKLEPAQSSYDIETQTSCITLEHPRWRKLHSTLSKVIKHLVPRLHEKISMRKHALKLLERLCKNMESLTYDKASAICTDAMLTAARLGVHEVVEKILDTFPPAVFWSEADTKHTYLHVAVKNRSEKVFNLMYRTNNHRYLYSNRRDSFGNSILHLAAKLAPSHKLNLVSGAALQMQRELQWFQEVNSIVSPYVRGLENEAGKRADILFTEEHKDLKIEGEKWMKDTANSCTIAATLIATVVFAAAITVPGGNESESGYPMFSKSSVFTIFAVSDAVSLFTSTTSLLMFLSILTSRYAEDDFLYVLPKRLCIGLFTLFLSILFMMIAFSSTLYLVFGRMKAWVLLPVGVLTCLPVSSFVLLQFPLLIDVFSSTYGRGIFHKQSDQRFH